MGIVTKTRFSSKYFKKRGNLIDGLRKCPKISILLSIQKCRIELLKKAIHSVREQIYQNWQLCIAVDKTTHFNIGEILRKIDETDDRIRIHIFPEVLRASELSAIALRMASGKFVTFLDSRDEISMNALYEVALVLNRSEKADFIYSDEDLIEVSGTQGQPLFKPDWSPDTLRSYNYIGDLAVIEREVIERAGGISDGDVYTRNYDLYLRLAEMKVRIVHIPKLLYHQRIGKELSGSYLNAARFEINKGRKALISHIRRSGFSASIKFGLFPGSYRVRFQILGSPRVTIIIPNKDELETLQMCISSILQHSSYKNYALVIVDNGSTTPEIAGYYERIQSYPNISVLEYNIPFNYSRIINYAVKNTNSDYIILLNNDTEIISPDWIESLLEFAQRGEIGAVGSLLYYPNGRVQHGGIILGIKGVAGHSHRHYPRESIGYCGRLKVIQNLSAVTAACLMTRKSVFEEVGGMDERLSHAYNDVDFCLKLRARKYLVVYTPYAELYHHEAFSRGRENTLKKKIRYIKEKLYFQWRWRNELAGGDPYYNPNLTLQIEDFSVDV